MRLDDIEIFHVVVETGGFTSAANVLDLPKSKVSRRISHLENSIGTTLFQRTTRHLYLTESGERYYQKTKILADEFRKLNDEVHDKKSNIKTTVRLQILNEAIEILPSLIDFQDKNPKINLDITTHSQQLLLQHTGFDLAMRVGPQPDSSMIARPIGNFTRVMVASPEYIQKYGLPKSPLELSQHNCLTFRAPDGILEKQWTLMGKEPINISGTMISNNAELIKRGTIAGEGISFLPEMLCLDEIEKGNLINIFPHLESKKETIWLVYPSKKHINHATRLLLDHLATHL
ncbi:LysR substrate-binding domain-containing protein (plasmid) [Vibrio sp. SS-MA-C1-2]|uniref:LysR family transcriptional regulator n=1 Tax=Vibrio sp. SS-MA-C1-2 TaxID=2908646 RepID=UPI001F2854E5|nr:LysR family transcriptional regulator [Vibrio sp. SS-MA-C1-2]UJF20297.1 LysR substrate-binding domain-containing protein [Vibrio sp. SS-MA-C1-2]